MQSLFDDRLGVSASVFNETKSNALQTDPATGLVNLQSSQKQRARGFSASVTGEVVEHFSLTAAYTYIEPKITQDATTPYNTGKQINFVPKNAVSLWGDYNAHDFLPARLPA